VAGGWIRPLSWCTRVADPSGEVVDKHHTLVGLTWVAVRGGMVGLGAMVWECGGVGEASVAEPRLGWFGVVSDARWGEHCRWLGCTSQGGGRGGVWGPVSLHALVAGGDEGGLFGRPLRW